MALVYDLISKINPSQPFFDSLRHDYPSFDVWLASKATAGERAYTFWDDSGELQGFMFLKLESEEVADVSPMLTAKHRVKIGTLKVNAHRTKLGERFMKKAIDWAMDRSVDELYVTVLPKHVGLLKLLGRFGFIQVASKGLEGVLVKPLVKKSADLESSYPLVQLSGRSFLLSIYPQWHTRLFPDSKLLTEGPNLIEDVSHTNSIDKVYLCNIRGVEDLRAGDVLVIYRTADEGKSAEYSSVASSICVVDEYKHISAFPTVDSFLEYALPFSVFTEEELRNYWRTRSYPKLIKFRYNLSLRKRPIRKVLIEDVGISRDAYPGFMKLTDKQVQRIAQLGGVDARFVVS